MPDHNEHSASEQARMKSDALQVSEKIASRRTMVDVGGELTNDPELAKAIAVSSFHERVRNCAGNRGLVRFCRACCFPISSNEQQDYMCIECRALADKMWLPKEAWLPRETEPADGPIRCGTFSGEPVRSSKLQYEQANRYVSIANRLMERFVGLFPNYVWTDEETAIDLMDAEIKTQRMERQSILVAWELETKKHKQRFDNILGVEIEERRAEQDPEWEGTEHDDGRSLKELSAYIDTELMAAKRQAISSEICTGQGLLLVYEQFESRMLKIAGLAVTAILSSRRKRS